MMLALFLACTAEKTPESAPADLPTLAPPAEGEGFQMSMTAKAPANSEAWACFVYSLPTTEPSPVNKVTYLQNDGTHHLTLSTTYLSETPLEPGMYDCNALYTETSLMQDAIMMFGNQGAAEGTLQLPEGVAAMLPAGIQVVHEMHYVNTTSEEIDLYSYLNAYTIDQSAVTDSIWGGQVRDEFIEIPAKSTATEWTRCVMNQDVEVLFLASHSHALATKFTIAPFDGTTTGEIFYTNTDWHDPLITQYQTPIVVPKGQGFEYACTYENPADAPVNYGYLSTDEMCNMTLVFIPGNPSAACEVVETSDGVLWQP